MSPGKVLRVYPNTWVSIRDFSESILRWRKLTLPKSLQFLFSSMKTGGITCIFSSNWRTFKLPMMDHSSCCRDSIYKSTNRSNSMVNHLIIWLWKLLTKWAKGILSTGPVLHNVCVSFQFKDCFRKKTFCNLNIYLEIPKPFNQQSS